MLKKNKIKNSLYSKKGELLFLHTNINGSTTEFITPNNFSLQVGHLIFTKNYLAKKHKHAMIPRQIPYTTEVLVILTGKVKYSIWDYQNPKKLLKMGIASAREILILGRVGHAFKSLQKTEIIEIKQGPYIGKLDKEYE